MKFLVDAQLPPALAIFLEKKGFHADHVVDVGLENADDKVIWSYALSEQMAIITKDEDFVEKLSLDSTGPSVVWIRVGNCSNQALIAWFSPLLLEVVRGLERGEKLLEIV
jgi:predicted nuclease of predicted toxin-antitoxin system